MTYSHWKCKNRQSNDGAQASIDVVYLCLSWVRMTHGISVGYGKGMYMVAEPRLFHGNNCSTSNFSLECRKARIKCHRTLVNYVFFSSLMPQCRTVFTAFNKFASSITPTSALRSIAA